MEPLKILTSGPVFDPNGTYDMGVVEMETNAEVNRFVAADPASKINHYEVYPMKAALPS